MKEKEERKRKEKPYIFFIAAEQFLFGVEKQQNYPLLVLKLVESHSDLNIKVAAAILFKNFVKRNWKLVIFSFSFSFLFSFFFSFSFPMLLLSYSYYLIDELQTEDGVSKIHPHDRIEVKKIIVSLMLASPPGSQKQLSEALAIIAENDFPQQWESLLPVRTFFPFPFPFPFPFHVCVCLSLSVPRHSRKKIMRASFKLLELSLGTCLHDSAQQSPDHERNTSDCELNLQALSFHVQIK
jgi:hypothetical protein